MRALLLPLFALALASIGCAHDEVAATCEHQASCTDGLDVGGCISERESNLGELSGRCGDAGVNAALAIYTCEAGLECGDDFEASCADELAAFEDARADGGESCVDAPGPIAPAESDA
ncbi:MAG: hypothetical protein Q8O67_22950 [Deltaproteobacteria bacterium]|nr:hypothetical protein [Deltaproteobacteria bacterium]